MSHFLSGRQLALNFISAKLKLKDSFRTVDMKFEHLLDDESKPQLPAPFRQAIELMRDKDSVDYVEFAEVFKDQTLTFFASNVPEVVEEACFIGVTIEKVYIRRADTALWLGFSVETALDSKTAAWVTSRFGVYVAASIQPQQKDLPLRDIADNIAKQVNAGLLDTPGTTVRMTVTEGGAHGGTA